MKNVSPADIVIPPKLKEYPSPIQEKVNLVKHQALIRDTQTMLEGPPPYLVGKLLMHVPDLEVIHKDSKNGIENNIVKESSEGSALDIIPPLQNDIARELWEEVRNFKDKDENSSCSAPFSVIHFTGSINSCQIPTPRDVTSDDVDNCSQANTLATLPSYIGKSKADTKILLFPLSRHLF